MEHPKPFNPLDKLNLARTIGSALLHQTPSRLPPDRFYGAGLYVIYYTGDFPLYRHLSRLNARGEFRQPIYVGKAIPAGGRKGGGGLDVPHGYAIHDRLCQHEKSIASATNLKTADFYCRWLAVEDVFIPLGETMLIAHFQPLWNVIVEGFGNNDPGRRRLTGKKPTWDVLHPGRFWSAKMPVATSLEQIEDAVKKHLASASVPPTELSVVD